MTVEPPVPSATDPGPRTALVSVVIPAFNRAATIAAALHSVQAQTHPDWEAIVVDDGSRDNTAEVVERHGQWDARIRLIRHSANRGAQAARNTGIRHARGSWIAFLDSDDRWIGDSLQVRLEAAGTRRLTVVHSDGFQRRDDGSIALYGLPALDGWIYRELLCRPGPVFQGLLVAREALERIGGLDERIIALQEWDTAIRLAEYNEFGFVRLPTFIWDRRGADTITKDRGRDARGYEHVVRKHAEAILNTAGPRALLRHYATMALRYLAAGEKAEAFRCLRALRRFGREGTVMLRGCVVERDGAPPAAPV